MMILFSGFRILLENLLPICVFFITAAGWGMLTLNLFPPTRHLLRGQKLLLSSLLGLLPLSILSFIFIQFSRFWPPAFIIGGRILLVIGLVYSGHFLWGVWKKSYPVKYWLISVSCVASFSLFVVLRLAFINELALPPYHDSVEHYRILLSFLNPGSTPSLFTGAYYHLGFHSLAAWLVEVAGVNPAQTISLLGQLILSLAPLSIYSFVFSLTHDWKPSLLTAAVGAFTWSMPAHAANWGKYPALTAIILLPAFLAVFVCVLNSSKTQWKPLHLGFSGLVLLVGISFIHTRASVCFILALASFLVARVVTCRIPLLVLKWLSLILVAGFLVTVFIIRSILWLYATPILFFILAIIFMLIGAYSNPRFGSGVAIWSLLICSLTLLPAPALFEKYSLNAIDMPFYQIITFLPFSLLTGIGMFAAIQWASRLNWMKRCVYICLAVFFIFVAINQAYVPDDCCNYATAKDLEAIDWIDANLPKDAHVAIPGRFDLYPVVGADAGIWITQLTGIQTFMLPYNYEWFDMADYQNVCDLGVVYLFASSFDTSFQINTITHPDWYQVVFENGGVVIYRLIGCENQQ